MSYREYFAHLLKSTVITMFVVFILEKESDILLYYNIKDSYFGFLVEYK